MATELTRIEKLSALEILDSRGRPTIKCFCTLEGGISASASVPSGASTGGSEAVELRDGNPNRFRGLGCLNAVSNLQQVLAPALEGESFSSQAALDHRLQELDGTSDKSNQGANTLLAVSLAFARATACSRKMSLHQYFSEILGVKPRMPRLTVNLFSGGKHAGEQVSIQDVLIVPNAETIKDSLASVYEVYQSAADGMLERFGMRALTADEGGLAPSFENSIQVLEEACSAIERAGLKPGQEMHLAVDVASSHFYKESKYELDGESLTGQEMIQTLNEWASRFPLVSIEDGLHEEAWEFWPELTQALDNLCLTLGDDFLCTNPGRIRRAVKSSACNALLLKLNQVGTLSEGAEACRLAREAGWKVVVSARSGETEDDWLADLAFGWAADYIKVGSITQSERLAKYNRLLEIESSYD